MTTMLVERMILFVCIALMIGGFLLPGLGQIGATILLMRG